MHIQYLHRSLKTLKLQILHPYPMQISPLKTKYISVDNPLYFVLTKNVCALYKF